MGRAGTRGTACGNTCLGGEREEFGKRDESAAARCGRAGVTAGLCPARGGGTGAHACPTEPARLAPSAEAGGIMSRFFIDSAIDTGSLPAGAAGSGGQGCGGSGGGGPGAVGGCRREAAVGSREGGTGFADANGSGSGWG